jgi:hypothetical protein
MSAPSGAGELNGHGGNIHAACENAWSKRSHGDPTEYVVTEITVTGTNPITGYNVIMRPK